MAYGLQAISTILTAIIVARLWWARNSVPFGVRAAALLTGVFLASPYVWDYDMVVLVFAAAWFAIEALNPRGFVNWEKLAFLILLIMPFLTMAPARILGLQFGPAMLWLVMAVLLRRALVIGPLVAETTAAPAILRQSA